jgi:acetyltransferase
MRAGSLGEAVVIAEELGFPVALKVHSPDITHKSDVGGVALDLGDVDALRRAWKRIEQTVAARRPEARLDGMVVEEMSRRRPGRELMIGVVRDPVFGPVVSVGIGGTAVEAIGDRSVMLPPLNRYLAGSMIEHTRAARLLGAFRGQAAACGGVVEDTLLRVSEMACELPTLVEMDLNPVIVDEDGIVVADARMVVARGVPQREPYAHMAVHPYPVDLVERLWLAGGEEVVLRPIRPEDAVIERDFVRALSAQSRYFRFMHALKELTPELLSRFTQIDYDREMALIAVVGAGGEEQQIGVARYVIMPDGETCEFAIVVADAWQGRGLGGAMMRALIAIARRKRLKRMQGQVLAANTAMLDFVRRLGFEVRPDPADATIALTTLDLWR